PTAVPMGLFETADGVINLAASGTTLFERFCKVASCEHLLKDERFIGPARAKHREALNAEISRVIATRTSAEWIEVLNAAGVPCGPVYRMDEVFADPQVRHLGIAKSVHHPRLGELHLVGQPIEISGVGAKLRSSAPDPGEHSAAVLSELGYSSEAIAELREKK